MDVPVDEVETREAETFLKKGADALMNDPEDDGWTEELAEALFESEELARFDSLRMDILHRIDDALDRGVEDEELADAFKDVLNETSNADSTAGQYLFLSNDAADDFESEVEFAYTALTTAYPLLVDDDPDDIEDPDFGGEFNTVAPGECEVTDEAIDDFFAYFSALYEYATSDSGVEDNNDPYTNVCGSWKNRIALYVCGAACAASTAGVGAALCGWACWCWWCSENSALADAICPN